MERYDLIIIGTGPAGLSAALTAKNRNLTFQLFGSRSLSPKVHKAHTITNYLGLPRVSGSELSRAFIQQMDEEEIAIREERIGAVYSMGDYQSVQVGEDFLEAWTVILATGVVAAKPLPGEEELIGRGVSYCATCDAALYRNRPVCVIADNPHEEGEAAFLADVCSKVTYFPLYRDDVNLPATVDVVRERPRALHATEGGTRVETDAGAYDFDCAFVLRASIAPSHLVPGIQTDGGHVTVDRSMATNLPGVFAAGDITGAPHQYMKAAGEGNVAAISAAAYIQDKKQQGAK